MRKLGVELRRCWELDNRAEVTDETEAADRAEGGKYEQRICKKACES